MAIKRKAVTWMSARKEAERAAAKGVVDEEEANETEAAKVTREDKEWNESRTKEIKAMYVDDLKKLAESKGVTVGKKDDMIKLIIKAEAKERGDRRAQQNK